MDGIKYHLLERFSQIILDEGRFHYSRMIKNCRLFISTYIYSTYNESLACKYPYGNLLESRPMEVVHILLENDFYCVKICWDLS